MNLVPFTAMYIVPMNHMTRSALYVRSYFPFSSFLRSNNMIPRTPIRNTSFPPTEFIVAAIEPGFSSATVVNVFGHRLGVAASFKAVAWSAAVIGPGKKFVKPIVNVEKIAPTTKSDTPIMTNFLVCECCQKLWNPSLNNL